MHLDWDREPVIDFRYEAARPDEAVDFSSRFYGNRICSVDGVRYRATWVVPVIDVDADDYMHDITAGEDRRVDLISKTLYGSMTYAWLLMLFNNIQDPFVDVTSDGVARAPRKGRMMVLLGSR